ncbi:hypothetical protein HGRIS_008552 [Hohenbuehelia grisea]|uniref:DNA (cytosine-5-)-methyltransferase n=1 Tax=Hohenbuehelia grisea TaxID=104357 RepID=A0ABR3J9T0_9AGAR
MSRRNRPSALDVTDGRSTPSGATRPDSEIPPTVVLKRHALDDGSRRPFKKRNIPVKGATYRPHRDEIPEANLVLVGEDPFADDGGKPIRMLHNFSMYDAKHGMDMVSIKALEEDPGERDCAIEASGLVSVYEANDEDAGQEDDLGDATDGVRVHLGELQKYSIEHLKLHDPVWIETSKAWYILGQPSLKYRHFFRHFYTPHRIAQMIFRFIRERPGTRYDALLEHLTSKETVFSHDISEQDILEAADEVLATLEDEATDEQKAKYFNEPIVTSLFRKTGLKLAPGTQGRTPRRGRTLARLFQHSLENIDTAVLRPENQTPTHVTPLIGRLAQPYVNESLQVVGPPRPLVDPAVEQTRREKELQLKRVRMKRLIRKTRYAESRNPEITDVEYERSWFVGKGPFLEKIKLRGEVYAVGDVVLMRRAEYRNREPPLLPKIEEVTDADHVWKYYWFAKIVCLNSRDFKVHAQWFEHSSGTAMEELGHSQQLYLNEICDSSHMRCIIEKVNVHFDPKGDIPPLDFFYRSSYNHSTGAYEDIDKQRMALAKLQRPPDNCPACLLDGQRRQDLVKEPIYLPDEHGRPKGEKVPDGVAFRGQTFHRYDYVLVRFIPDDVHPRTASGKAPTGPARIAQIIEVQLEPPKTDYSWQEQVRVRWLGRIAELGNVLPDGYMRDERHLYLTREAGTVKVSDLIRVCHVLPYEDSSDFAEYLQLSPDHFYCKFTFQSLKVEDWEKRAELAHDQVRQCQLCCEKMLERLQKLQQFLKAKARRPIRALDLFGGVGAFALSIAEGAGKGLVDVTHAVEISPSAAKTFRRNSPTTTVYNQCANVILRYCIKANMNLPSERPKQIHDQTDVAPPLRPGDVDLITVGFPCQSHSGLNMYKKAEDIKSNLILTALSYVDFLRPNYCYFENVRGFLSFHLGSTQVDEHRTEGGIQMGGMKFLLRALDEMGYQFRYALMQAANYGTPQRRVRFFLHAAKHGYPLPDIAQATHHAPVPVLPPEALAIHLPNTEYTLRNIQLTNGITPHHYVSINDAISDLPKFDWKHPRPTEIKGAKAREHERRRRTIPEYTCDKSTGQRCGPVQRVPPYVHAPRTSFQLRCRPKPTQDLQHFTLTLPPRTVERAWNIEMQPEADYRSLQANHKEYQAHGAFSSLGRGEFRPGQPCLVNMKRHEVQPVNQVFTDAWTGTSYFKRL